MGLSEGFEGEKGEVPVVVGTGDLPGCRGGG